MWISVVVTNYCALVESIEFSPQTVPSLYLEGVPHYLLWHSGEVSLHHHMSSPQTIADHQH